MPHILRKADIELHLDLPTEGYQRARFDWTGKITMLRYKGRDLATTESAAPDDQNLLGRGFYNEFGIDLGLGFEETEPGDWFHKIGVGLLRKDDEPYSFAKAYEIRPAVFQFQSTKDQIRLSCQPEAAGGFAYVLHKGISLTATGFAIEYLLQNIGQKPIVTDEYVHNFTAINRAAVGSDYILRFPFQIQPEAFGETVNPEGKVKIGARDFQFAATPDEAFFFSNLCAGQPLATSWELCDLKQGLGIRERIDFPCSKVNLWGCGHVISPELFCHLSVPSGASFRWSRRYEVFEL